RRLAEEGAPAARHHVPQVVRVAQPAPEEDQLVRTRAGSARSLVRVDEARGLDVLLLHEAHVLAAERAVRKRLQPRAVVEHRQDRAPLVEEALARRRLLETPRRALEGAAGGRADDAEDRCGVV